MKTTLKDLFVREEKSASQNMVLEALAAGSQEEVKVHIIERPSPLNWDLR
jgi:hypothetical protein